MLMQNQIGLLLRKKVQGKRVQKIIRMMWKATVQKMKSTRKNEN